jgi:hypothetical protein
MEQASVSVTEEYDKGEEEEKQFKRKGSSRQLSKKEKRLRIALKKL